MLLLSQLPFWVLMVAAFSLLSITLHERVVATNRATHVREELAQVAGIMQHVVDMETGLRGFVIAGNPVFLEPYTAARAALPGEFALLQLTLRQQVNPREAVAPLAHLNRVEALVGRWQTTVAEPEIAARARGLSEAAAFVKQQTGKRLLDSIRAEVEAYQQARQQQLQRAETAAAAKLRSLQLSLYGVAALTILGSVAASLVGASLLRRSLGAVTDAAERLTAGETVTLAERRASPAEIQTLSRAFNHMSGRLAQARRQADEHARELAARNVWMRTLGELSDWLQAARSLEEAAGILERALPALLPGTQGTLHHHNASRNLLLAVVSWGGAEARPSSPGDCWALRRGEARQDAGVLAPPCLHGPQQRYLCLPLFSHGETLGTLRLQAQGGEALSEATRAAAEDVAQQVALALAGLRLLDRLQQQAIRDPLTGLFNRRHLEEQLEQRVLAAEAAGQPLSLVALDVDHFKRLNDSFGHEAGDMVLVRMGAALRDLSPAPALAARPGGEEFSILLPDQPLPAALELAERLRSEVAGWTLEFAGMPLGPVSVSIGVAGLGSGIATGQALTRAADDALYQAKRTGRNRVVPSDAGSPARISSLPS
ncbi:diguanylate cyclase [Deinococcus koreensis]|nr:diguanylate cyclase [Deinococcus koreensis]